MTEFLPGNTVDAATGAEDHSIKCSANPAALIGIYCLKYALSRNAMIALLELLRLKLDVSAIQNVDQILNGVSSAPANLQSACRNCYADLDLEYCVENW